jgi:hypothetical protein
LQVAVEVRAQLQERLEPHFHEKVVAGEIEQPPEQLDRDQAQTQQGDEIGRVPETRLRILPQNVVDYDLKRPRFQQAERDSRKRQNKPEDRPAGEWPVIGEDAAVDRHS